MSDRPPPVARQVSRLARALAWSDGFLFALLITPSRRVLGEALGHIDPEGRAVRVSPPPRAPFAPETVLNALAGILADAAPTILVLDATAATRDEAEGWATVFRRLNERRNGIVRAWPAPFLLALPAWLAPVFAREAPDFWSIRDLTLHLEDTAPSPTSGRVSEPEPARTRAAPWETDVDAASAAVEEARNSGAPPAILAGRLNRLADAAAHAGRWKDALEATREAVEIRRALAKEQPAAFLPDLARSLHNLGMALGELGRHEEALAATREAVQHHRALAAERPGAFLPDLARSLHNLGAALGALGRREEALEATREAVEHYHALAKEQPAAFFPALASSLDTLGTILLELDRPAEACEAFREGLGGLRPFLHRHPSVHAKLAEALVAGYRRACAAAGVALDEALVESVEAALAG